MIPTRTVFESWVNLLVGAADLNPPEDGNVLALIDEDFTESLDNTAASISHTEDGTTHPLITLGVDGVTSLGISPETAEAQIRSDIAPNEEQEWTSSGAAFPITYYGYAMLNQSVDTLFGTYKFPSPITFTRTGQTIEVPDRYFRFPPSMVR